MIVTHNELSLKDQRTLWLSHNKGVIKRISEETGISHAYCCLVWRGQATTRGRRVERMLAERGAPGFERFLEAAGVDSVASVVPSQG